MRPSTQTVGLLALLLTSSAARAEEEAPPPQMMHQPDLAPGEVFPGTTLQCLVCQAIVDEFAESIAAVDPNKKVEATAGRMDSNGNTNAKVVRYDMNDRGLIFHSDLMKVNLCTGLIKRN